MKGVKLPALYPFVRSVFQPTSLARGPFAQGVVGVTVHHAADRDLDRVKKHGASTRIGYHLVIDRDGFVHQTAYLDQQVAHAGNALWNGVSPNRAHVAVCVLSWGRVTRGDGGFKSWSGALVPTADVVRRPGRDGKPGTWDLTTAKQEAALLDVLAWLVACGIDPAQVCGHDECALPLGRKDDPGGVLSCSMKQVRERLAKGVKS